MAPRASTPAGPGASGPTCDALRLAIHAGAARPIAPVTLEGVHSIFHSQFSSGPTPTRLGTRHHTVSQTSHTCCSQSWDMSDKPTMKHEDVSIIIIMTSPGLRERRKNSSDLSSGHRPKPETVEFLLQKSFVADMASSTFDFFK